MRNYKTIIPNLLITTLLFSLSGCSTMVIKDNDSEYDYHYINPEKRLTSVGKIVLIELDNNSSFPATSTDLTRDIYHSLQKNPLFSTTLISNDDARWVDSNIDLYSTYTLDQLVDLQGKLQCDAVLTGIVTQYTPYPHMNIGIRLKLVDLRDGNLLWAHEQSWDCNDKTIEKRIKNYLNRNTRLDDSEIESNLLTVSPLKFMKFVAYEVTETMMPELPKKTSTVFGYPQ